MSIAAAHARREQCFPLAELHCHIEGAAPPALVERLAASHGIDVSAIIRDGAYVWHDFTSFLAAYDLASTVFRSEGDYADLAFAHLSGLAAAGALYAEFFISPDHARASGTEPDVYARGLAAGIARARRETGIEARMIAVGVRHLGAEAVEAAARFAAGAGRPLITGFNLAGDERIGQPRDFMRAFDIARDAGLGLTAHAGELCGPESVRETIACLKPSRIGHGVRAIEDPDLVRGIAERGIVLEVCPGSNLALGLYPDIASHPLKRLVEAGVKACLGADDPPFFHTDLAREYRLAAENGLGPAERIALTRNALEAAFVEADLRRTLLDRLQIEALSLGAPGASH
ncbi:adenosine deaminase [Aurantimonas sp. 22II-16-19i]|uniref:adenosine deaminase n=1 Tax=Aurantimonas sp. 22II-16-19i TaxID=1317114 RepID=UPI0009F7B3AC|nr:adenosine deaminase [Aurantimonas sp. 22II-16-19i]ORE98368.1 adenosine deaminase [Aurantimonas sp. 22II-16-19i]